MYHINVNENAGEYWLAFYLEELAAIYMACYYRPRVSFLIDMNERFYSIDCREIYDF